MACKRWAAHQRGEVEVADQAITEEQANLQCAEDVDSTNTDEFGRGGATCHGFHGTRYGGVIHEGWICLLAAFHATINSFS